MVQRTRYDSNRVKLRTGEYQKADGHYEYRYTVFGKKQSIYAKNLETLREKECDGHDSPFGLQIRFVYERSSISRFLSCRRGLLFSL